MKGLGKEISEWMGVFSSIKFANESCFQVGSFGIVGVVDTEEGLVVFDLDISAQGEKIFREIRAFSDKPIKYIIYSHGHFDHCFGFKPFIEEIKEKDWEMPQVIGHENLLERFEKYRILEDYHKWINSMQFSSTARKTGKAVSAQETLDPTIIVRGNEGYEFKLGGLTFEIYHDKGETDDSLWMFVPEKEVLFTGDLYLSCFPNVGNPYKVQRYPKHWARAMERMAEKNAKYLVPGHGKLIEGRDNVKECLTITAEAMHFVHDEVVKRMNQGKWFEEIYHEMLGIFPDKFKNSKYLKPIYGCYRFAIHATHRLYHGWYNSGNPTTLFPARSADIAREFLKINGPEKYLAHATRLYEEGKLQLALHIIDPVIQGSDEASSSQTYLDALELKFKILKQQAIEEPSYIADNIIRNEAEKLKRKMKKLKKK